MSTASTPVSPSSSSGAARIAVVCRAGDESAKALVAFLDQLGVSSMTAGAGATPSAEAVEKLRHAEFAILMRSDRPMETGFLLGALGAARVCLLLGPQSSAPGLDALTRIPLDNGGVWHLLLAREMKKAGLDIDLNKAF